MRFPPEHEGKEIVFSTHLLPVFHYDGKDYPYLFLRGTEPRAGTYTGIAEKAEKLNPKGLFNDVRDSRWFMPHHPPISLRNVYNPEMSLYAVPQDSSPDKIVGISLLEEHLEILGLENPVSTGIRGLKEEFLHEPVTREQISDVHWMGYVIDTYKDKVAVMSFILARINLCVDPITLMPIPSQRELQGGKIAANVSQELINPATQIALLSLGMELSKPLDPRRFPHSHANWITSQLYLQLPRLNPNEIWNHLESYYKRTGGTIIGAALNEIIGDITLLKKHF